MKRFYNSLEFHNFEVSESMLKLNIVETLINILRGKLSFKKSFCLKNLSLEQCKKY